MYRGKKCMRLPALFLAMLLAVALLSGCGKKQSETVTAQEEQKQTLPTDEEQRRVIEENRSLWAFEDPWDSPWYYTIVDMDHNGLLEVLAATTQGSGIYTYAHYYEVLADGSGLLNLYHRDVEIEGPDDWPEIVRDSLDFYYDAASDTYYYICEGVTREGAARHYYSLQALCLKDGIAEWELLATKSVEWTDSGETISCADPQGNYINEFEYNEAAEDRYEGLEKRSVALFWTDVENPMTETDSEYEPPAEPVSETAADPAPSSSTLKVYKNPTSEALAIGGKTWFIAHAENADSITWQMVDPSGNVYTPDSAMAANPGLQLQELPDDTLAVSNVPLSVNGWGVQAVFKGDGTSAATTPAFIYVGDFLKNYDSVLQKYKTAFTPGAVRNLETASNLGVSEFIEYSDHVGYALKDLNKDGIPELLIAGIGTQEFGEQVIYDLYTLENNSPKNIATSWARNRYYLRTDSLIVNEGSSGAAYSNVFLFSVNKQGLSPVEGIITYFPGDERDSCYHQVGHCDYEPQQSDQRISMEEYTSEWNNYKAICYVPPLTTLA